MIKGKNVLITGATSGIGKEITRMLLEAGANVAYCGRSKEKLQSFVTENKVYASKQCFRAFDLTNESEIFSFIDESYTLLGDIDILINCAGINSEKARVESITTKELRNMMEVNMLAPFIFIREIYKKMIEKRSGLIINILSTVCKFSNENIASYTASKAGFDALVKVLRKEAREHHVKISSVYPGGVDTDFRPEARPQYLSAKVVAESVLSLITLSEESCMDELVIRPMIEKNYA